MTDYTPIDCALHSEHELAVLQGRRLRICWCQADGQLRVENLKPCDLRSRRHEEYLVAGQPDGRQRELRLDYIKKIEPL